MYPNEHDATLSRNVLNRLAGSFINSSIIPECYMIFWSMTIGTLSCDIVMELDIRDF